MNSIKKTIWIFPFLHRNYNTNLKKIGLEITNYCNLGCYNCESSCGNINSNDYMSCQQINKFVDDSIWLNWKWDVIKIRGGEPTLHPQIFKVIEIIKKYKNFNPGSKIILQTNGYSIKTKKILSLLPDWIVIRNSNKKDKQNEWFNSYNKAPIDSKYFILHKNYNKGCYRTEVCNIGLSKYGYYPCCPGADVDRIFGFGLGIKKLSLIIDKKLLKKQLSILCKYCGHYKEPNEEVNKNLISRSWKLAYENCIKSKPILSEY